MTGKPPVIRSEETLEGRINKILSLMGWKVTEADEVCDLVELYHQTAKDIKDEINQWLTEKDAYYARAAGMSLEPLRLDEK